MTMKPFRFAILILLFGFCSSRSFSQNAEAANLKGIKAVDILVDDVPDDNPCESQRVMS